MSSNDAWGKIPNLSGQRSSSGEISRVTDPSRFFPPVANGNVDAVTGRILNVPRCAAYRLAAHNVAFGGAYTPIQMDTIDYDTDQMISLSTPTLASRITCRTTGHYDFNGTILWPAPGTVTFRNIGILKNGAIWKNLINYPNTAGAHSQVITGKISMVTGDYIELAAQQNTGVVIALLGNTFSPRDISYEVCLDSTVGSDGQ